jgi:hypothetical protein
VDLAADLRDPELRIAFVARQRDLALKSLGRMVERVCSMPDRGGVAAALTAGPGDDLESVLREWLDQVDVPVIRFPASDSPVSRDSLRALAVSLPSEPAVVIVENFPDTPPPMSRSSPTCRSNGITGSAGNRSSWSSPATTP